MQTIHASNAQHYASGDAILDGLEATASVFEHPDSPKAKLPEHALDDALQLLAFRREITSTHIDRLLAFAAKHDLHEQDRAVLTARIDEVWAQLGEQPGTWRRPKLRVVRLEGQKRERALIERLHRRYPSEEAGYPMEYFDALSGTFERGDHVELGQRLLTLQRMIAETTFTEGDFYRYDAWSGTYQKLPEAELSRMVQSFAGRPVATSEGKSKPLRIKSADVKGTIALAADGADDPEFFAKARAGIAFFDAFIEVTAAGIVKHDPQPDHRARTAYAFAYEHDAEPDQFLRFLSEVFAGDEDRDDKVAFLQEHVGMSLIGLGTKMQQAALLKGKGANGKSAFLSIVDQCMPEGTVSAIPPQDLDQDYKRALLTSARINIVSELPENEIVASESWKAVVDGSRIGARSPYGRPFTLKPTAGHLYSANRLPGTSDHTHGFWRRWMVISFNRVFAAHEQDPDLVERIIAAERPAIVAWFLQGAARALANGSYTTPASSAAAVKEWRSVADQVAAYVDAECERLPSGTASTQWAKASRVYDDYRAWAQRSGHSPMSLMKFGERMQGLGLGSDRQGRGCLYPVRVLAKGEHLG